MKKRNSLAVLETAFMSCNFNMFFSFFLFFLTAIDLFYIEIVVYLFDLFYIEIVVYLFDLFYIEIVV